MKECIPEADDAAAAQEALRHWQTYRYGQGSWTLPEEARQAREQKNRMATDSCHEVTNIQSLYLTTYLYAWHSQRISGVGQLPYLRGLLIQFTTLLRDRTSSGRPMRGGSKSACTQQSRDNRGGVGNNIYPCQHACQACLLQLLAADLV